MTNRPIRVLSIPGRLRGDSYKPPCSRPPPRSLRHGMSMTVYDELGTVPAFNEDLEQPTPPGVARLREAVATSHRLLIATPEYNQSLPGVVKNMIDFLASREPVTHGRTSSRVAVADAGTPTLVLVDLIAN